MLDLCVVPEHIEPDHASQIDRIHSGPLPNLSIDDLKVGRC